MIHYKLIHLFWVTFSAIWVDEIVRVLSSTDKAISTLGWLAGDIAVAEGNCSKDNKEMRKQYGNKVIINLNTEPSVSGYYLLIHKQMM